MKSHGSYLFFCIFIVKVIFSKAYRVFPVNGVETILAMEKERITIQCKTDMPMAYCGFIHPNGKRYSFTEASLEAGNCAVKINASSVDSGQWRCHIGTKGSIGEEIVQHLDLRVVNKVAAVQKNITTIHGKEVTIACATTQGLTPINYCRFEPPKGTTFSINQDVNETMPILGRYYFPNNKSLNRGDCAVTIRKVKYEDLGVWTCGAGLDGQEHIDTISVSVEGIYAMSSSSATGISFGAVCVSALLVYLGYLGWKKRHLLGAGRRRAEPAEDHELSHVAAASIPGTPQRTPRGSRRGSPAVTRADAPILTIQSPSEPSSSSIGLSG